MLPLEEQARLQSMELNIQRVAIGVENLRQTFLRQIDSKDIPQFCTLKRAWQLKGGAETYKSLQKQKWFQPMCGTGAVMVNGRRCWTREVIIEWLSVTDATLEMYAEKYGVDISKHFCNGRNVHE